MKFKVNIDQCIGCSACEICCPEIFEMYKEEYSIAKDVDAQGEVEDRALEAVENCPTSAIEILD